MTIKQLDRHLMQKSLLFHSVPWGSSEGPPFFLSSLFLVQVSLLGCHGWSLLRDSLLSARHLGKETNSLPSTNEGFGVALLMWGFWRCQRNVCSEQRIFKLLMITKAEWTYQGRGVALGPGIETWAHVSILLPLTSDLNFSEPQFSPL